MDCPISFFMTLLENCVPYIAEEQRRNSISTVDLKMLIEEYLSLVDRGFRAHTSGITFTFGISTFPLPVFGVGERPLLINAIVGVLLVISNIDFVLWKPGSLGLPAADPRTIWIPPISSPMAKELSPTAVTTFIESGWFRFRPTNFLDRHVTFDPDSETILIYAAPRLEEYYFRFEENQLALY